jgi:hypothetical protein
MSAFLKFKLDRKNDRVRPCCRNFATARFEENSATELRCCGCGELRGSLSRADVNRLLDLLAHFPEAQHDMHIIRDSKKT